MGITEEARLRAIDQALAAREARASSERLAHPLIWRGSERIFPVVELPLAIPLLNADSYRIRSQLEVPDYARVRSDRASDEAQATLADLWKKAHRKYEGLKESLEVHGQDEYGVVTRAGVMVNGNTRLVALRELNLPARQVIKVAVLDGDATPEELRQLEMRLQVREPFRDPLRLSGELLSIEEMKLTHHWTEERIAEEMNWNPKRPALGKKKVVERLRWLELIRKMQQRDSRLPITFFDESEQHLKELDLAYTVLTDDGEIAQANELLDTWLVVARSGFDSVHKIRAVLQSRDFVADYLLPRMGEQMLMSDCAPALVDDPEEESDDLPGLGDLDSGDAGTQVHNLQPLLRIVEMPPDEMVVLPGQTEGTPAEHVQHAVRKAIDGALEDHGADKGRTGAREAPVKALRQANLELRRAIAAYGEVKGTHEFERNERRQFEFEYKHLRKEYRKLENLMSTAKDAAN